MASKFNNVPKDLEENLKNLIECISKYKKEDIYIADRVNYEFEVGVQEVNFKLDLNFYSINEVD